MPTEKNSAFWLRQWGFKLDRERVKIQGKITEQKR
jgi:hypothetical protein